jgi:hypothetical protein
MGFDDVRLETPAQWLEHSAAWRYAHLEQAPSEHLRRMAIHEHELALHPMEPTAKPTAWQAWGRLPLATRVMIVSPIAVVAVVLGVRFL